MTVANLVTSIRFVLAPLVILYYSQQRYLESFLCALVALLSDYFDGKIARRFHQTSVLGTFLDPIADKYYELWLTLSFYHLGKLPIYFVCLVWIRNIAQLLSIPILMWWKKIEFKVEPKWYSKWASAIVMVILLVLNLAGVFILFKASFAELLENYLLNYFLIPISILFEMYMLYDYLPRFWQIYRGKHDTFH